MNKKETFDLIVIGSGAAGIISSIVAARNGKSVLLLEKLSQIASKLKATGGGRCNLTNTLSNEDFMARFGRDGRFMQDALKDFDHKDLVSFFNAIGVDTHAPDGFRIFPTSHSSVTIITALEKEMQRLGITVICKQKVEEISLIDASIASVTTQTHTYWTTNLILATGGLGYPVLGAEGDGHTMATSIGHKVTDLHPAMMPLKTKETWVANCRADTIAKVTLKVDIKKHKKLRAKGDLIFTKTGVRGPVILDFAREVTPLLEKYGEVPLLLNLTKGMNEEEISQHIKRAFMQNPHAEIVEVVTSLLPLALSEEICKLAGVNPHATNKEFQGEKKVKLIQLLTWTPLTISGHDGFKLAMITRGGIHLKEIDPKTMQSKLIKGLYFCGEIMNLDGPCGGYNLQWSFASGNLAGKLL
ncbi:NAD(P)/FAD-dependent oxidoreductase [Sulfurimonas sp. SAG-AH-194-I05]|nr:NAD(P)/FAD-dependent oxidoreductase [Sulfurimonas sp. SAG-AH-194-I05]MDF1876140.1 NAD(P)/FAD-dependent oxidoreductase [Sulfurimonas sp. SAG-AH-194-I05]